MSDEQLRKLIEESSAAERSRWLMRQKLLARALRNGLRKRLGRQIATNTVPIELPEEDEIVNDTICRVLSRHEEGKPTSYVWDGSGSFDKFFARCLRRTMEALRSKERRNQVGLARLRPEHREQSASIQYKAERNVYFATPHLDSREQIDQQDDKLAIESQFDRALATAIVENRMRGNAIKYMQGLPKYAKLKMTTDEIAIDLNVKPSSIDSYRKRVRRVLKDPEGD